MFKLYNYYMCMHACDHVQAKNSFEIGENIFHHLRLSTMDETGLILLGFYARPKIVSYTVNSHFYLHNNEKVHSHRLLGWTRRTGRTNPFRQLVMCGPHLCPRVATGCPTLKRVDFCVYLYKR